MRVRLAQEVFGFVYLVGGVDRDEHGADLGGGPEGDEPSRHVGGPDGDLAARLHAQREQGAGEVVDVVAELFVGTRVIERGVAEGVLVGEFLHHAVEHLGEGEVDELVFLPDVLARAVVVQDQGVARLLGVVEAAHVVDVVREDDARVVEAVDPGGLAFDRDEAVVVDRGERAHHVGDGQGALAHQVEVAVVGRVAHVHVAHVGTQVANGDGRLLAEVAHGMVDVPQGGDVVAREFVEHLHQAFGIGVDAGGFEQDGHLLLAGAVDEGRKRGAHAVFVVVVGLDAHALGAGDGGQVDELLDLFDVVDVIGNVDRRVEDGDFNSLAAQVAGRGAGDRAVEGSTLAREGLVGLDVAHLDTVEFHFSCEADQFVPGTVLPASSGKRKLH